MTRDIKKVKVTSNRTLEATVIERLPNNSTREVTLKCEQLVHDDLYKAFDRLKLHLVKLCDLYEGKDLDPETCNTEYCLKNFKVTSFSIGGSDENEGVTLTGFKEFPSKKLLNLNTPFTKWEDEYDPYEWASDMSEAIQGCIYEAEQYLYAEKYAVKQLDIPFDEETGENSDGIVESAKEEINKPKRGRKKKDYTVTAIVDGQEHDVSDKF